MKIQGTVVHGKHIGRTLGFPTANIRPDGEVTGIRGVYAAWFYIGEAKYGCMVNIGRHPTLPEGEKTIEAHIFDYRGDLYGAQVCVETVQMLRPEVKFPSVEALRSQLEQDARSARSILNIQNPPGIE